MLGNAALRLISAHCSLTAKRWPVGTVPVVRLQIFQFMIISKKQTAKIFFKIFKKPLTFLRIYLSNYYTEIFRCLICKLKGGLFMAITFILIPLLTLFSPLLVLDMAIVEGLSITIGFLAELLSF